MKEWLFGQEDPWTALQETVRLIGSSELFEPVDDYWERMLSKDHYQERLVLCFVSLLANISVLTFHFTTPPHPKFLIHWRRRLAIRLHIQSGTLEMIQFLAMLYFRMPIIALGLILACWCHVATSSYLITGLFGIRCFMAPCYIAAVTAHFLNGLRLFLDLKNPERTICTFLTLQIYVWVRVIYAFLARFSVLTKYHYTLSVIFAGFAILPAAGTSGFLANFGVMLFILFWNLFEHLMPASCVRACPHVNEEGNFVLNRQEVSRANMVSHFFRRPERTNDPASVERAGETFSNSHSTLGSATTSTPGAETEQVASYFEVLSKQSCHMAITEEAPYHRRHFSSAIPAHRDSYIEGEECRADALQVFKSLCANIFVGMTEEDLQRLLAVWGLPFQEAALVMEELRPKLANPSAISFMEFYEHMAPVWKYAAEVLEYHGHFAAGSVRSLAVSGLENRGLGKPMKSSANESETPLMR